MIRGLLLLAFACLNCSGIAAEVRVFAAASFTDVLKELAASFEAETSTRVVLNFGASSTLARQIEEGAPADLFISADTAQVDKLIKASLADAAARRVLVHNSLAIVVEPGNPLRIWSAADLGKARRIAVADPRTVPAGVYARRYLETRKLWTALQARIVPTQNVRAALAAVESGNADAALVYKTDAAISKKVEVAAEIPREETPEVASASVVLREARNGSEARQFLEFLGTPGAGEVFRRFGFMLPADSSPRKD